MNKQGTLINGKVVGGIEWTKTVLPDGTERQGYTWNPVGGCRHGCRWEMPDGAIARCYAEAVAEGVARQAYPQGFTSHYWHPQRLDEPSKVTDPSRIFLDSMSDLMGTWVPQSQVRAVLDQVAYCHWHDFQLLTKAPARLLKFGEKFPENLWIGVSMPPTFMMGVRLSPSQQERYMKRTMDVFEVLRRKRPNNVLWLSLEPLSFDVAPLLRPVVDWLVIGAATNGRKAYQPDKAHVENVLGFAAHHDVPVFFKGNLDWSPWREDFPTRR